MKKKAMFPLLSISLLLTGCGAAEGAKFNIWPWILEILGLAVLALAVMQTLSYLQYVKKTKRRKRNPKPISIMTIGCYGVAVLFLLLALIIGNAGGKAPDSTGDSTSSSTTAAGPQARWEGEGKDRRYILEDGSVATGWQDIGNKRYYFNQDGSTLSGWQEVEGMERFFRADGSMARGEETIDGVTYFFTSTGAQVEVANPWNAVPDEYPVELMDLSTMYATSGIKIDVKIYEPLKEMMDACNAAMAAQYGSSASKCCVTSGYRTMDDQIRIYNNQIAGLLNKGYSQEAAEIEAATAVAVPGTSEHQLGLAVDIVDTGSWQLDEFQDDLPAQQWLIANSWEYGFILRYPEGKTDVTGIIYEPWHYRYVGKELAKELHELNLTLEEYLDSLD